MWLRTQANRLLNLEKIQIVELVSRRETTAGTVVYELIAREGLGQTGNCILGRFATEEPGAHLLEEIAHAIETQKSFTDLIALEAKHAQ